MAADRTVWRITTERHADNAFDGEGARLYGGRWNHPGTAVVYCSSTLSLSALEYFVHLEPSLAPRNLVAIRAVIPPEVPLDEVGLESLPRDWRTYPASETLKDIGSSWVRAGHRAGLVVPSSIVPYESNMLLSPAHPDFVKIRVGEAEMFSFDPRMWK
jgi:RES domain-containing protein